MDRRPDFDGRTHANASINANINANVHVNAAGPSATNQAKGRANFEGFEKLRAKEKKAKLSSGENLPEEMLQTRCSPAGMF